MINSLSEWIKNLIRYPFDDFFKGDSKYWWLKMWRAYQANVNKEMASVILLGFILLNPLTRDGWITPCFKDHLTQPLFWKKMRLFFHHVSNVFATNLLSFNNKCACVLVSCPSQNKQNAQCQEKKKKQKHRTSHVPFKFCDDLCSTSQDSDTDEGPVPSPCQRFKKCLFLDAAF